VNWRSRVLLLLVSMKTSQKDYLNWKKYMDDNNKMIDKKIKAKEVVENIIDYIK